MKKVICNQASRRQNKTKNEAVNNQPATFHATCTFFLTLGLYWLTHISKGPIIVYVLKH